MTETGAGEAAGKRFGGEAAVIFVCAAMLIDTISFGILIPVLPQFLVELTGETMSEATRTAGWLMVLFAGLQFLFGPIIGNLSDRFGRRPVLLLSMAAFAVNYALMGFAESVWVLFLGRAVTGAAGAIFAPANAYVADITPPERRAQRFALVGAAFGLGFILGPALGGLVGQISPRAPFFLAAAMAGLNLLFGLFVLPESLPRERRRPFDWRRANPVGAFAAIQRHPEVLSIVLCIFLFNFAFQVYPATWSFFASLKFDWGPGAIGAQLAFSGVLMVIMQGAMTGRIVRAIGEQRAVMLGMTSAILGMACNVLATHGWQTYLCALVGCLHGLSTASMNALATSRMPPDQQGELQGAVSSLNGIAAIASPLLLTQTLAYFTGPSAPVHFAGAAFTLSAFIALGALALFFVTQRHTRGLAAQT